MTTSADDFSSDVNTLGRLAVGGSAGGVFESSYDTDWFKVHLDAGTNYQFGTGRKVDALALVSALGYDTSTVFARTSADPAVAPTISYRPLVSGDYFVSVSAYSQAAAGAYTVYARQIVADDIGPTTGSA